MRDGYGGVVAAQERGEGRVDQGLGFRIQGRRGFVEDEDVWVLDERAGDGYALFLAAGELGAAGSYGGF